MRFNSIDTPNILSTLLSLAASVSLIFVTVLVGAIVSSSTIDGASSAEAASLLFLGTSLKILSRSLLLLILLSELVGERSFNACSNNPVGNCGDRGETVRTESSSIVSTSCISSSSTVLIGSFESWWYLLSFAADVDDDEQVDAATPKRMSDKIIICCQPSSSSSAISDEVVAEEMRGCELGLVCYQRGTFSQYATIMILIHLGFLHFA